MLRAACGAAARCARARAGARALSAARAAAGASDGGGDREEMEYDLLIVGAGPAGLSAALRAKQLAGDDLSVCVIEKGAEVGAHVLSGNVFEPRALDELLPDWRDDGAHPFRTEAKEDVFAILTETAAVRVPLTPPHMRNDGNYIVSLSQVTRWLAGKAEEAGVDIFPGFCGAELLFEDDGAGGRAVGGVATGDMGVARDGTRKDTFERGMALRARATLLAEGCRGSLSQAAMEAFGLRGECQPQTYALGVKEVWEVPAGQHSEGTVWHSVGWPLDDDTYGGSFLYHMADNRVALGMVVALDYADPTLSPFEEFQRWKTHPAVRAVLEGGECVQYGARALNEGGYQSVPRLHFPGGALVGCAAGFLNVPKIKGTHTAMKSGMLAAEAAVAQLLGEGCADEADEGAKEGCAAPVDLSSYEGALRSSWVWEELYLARNIRPGFKHGLYGGLVNAAVDTYLFGGRAPWTLEHEGRDRDAFTERAGAGDGPLPTREDAMRRYPKPDGVLTFDRLTSLARSGTNHEHDQPAHLRVSDEGRAAMKRLNYDSLAGGPETRYCPAGVYEWVVDDDELSSGGGKEEGGEGLAVKLVINAQNCLHCKVRCASVS